jgi:hypothetical protein
MEQSSSGEAPKSSANLMEPEGLLQYSQQPTTWPSRKPDQSSPRYPLSPYPMPRRSILISSSPRHLRFVKCAPALRFTNQILRVSLLSTPPPHVSYDPNFHSSRFESVEGLKTQLWCVTTPHSGHTSYLNISYWCQNTQLVFSCAS